VKTPLGIIGIFLILMLGCEKKDQPDPNSQTQGYIESFISLTSEKDSLYPGESTKITALVDGDCVQYEWNATQGDLLGNGKEVTYIAQLCDCGKSRINCTASAGSYKICRSLIIYIKIDE
jgi:hypothetical protein